MKINRTTLIIFTSLAVLALLLGANFGTFATNQQNDSTTMTPIKHVVVIFQENVSFDHYFGTYPNATNPPNEPQFTAKPDTPTVNGLTAPLLTENPNYLYSCSQPGGCNASDNPALLPRTEPVTCDNDHGYSAEQAAFNGGLMNQFPEQTSCSDGLVMDYYDGNSVTALWNYAQYFALNDNQFGTTFGPSTPGALNVVSGIGGPAAIYVGPEGSPTKTYTKDYPNPPDSATSGNNVLANGQVINDIDPVYDDCSYTTDGSTATAGMVPTSGASAPINIGNLLNDAGVTWGWFQGGFTPTGYTASGQAICGTSNANVGGDIETSYVPHREPFQYFASTSNPHHLPPSSAAMIGYTDQANHQYDLSSFWIAADSGNLPAVSYLKSPSYQSGHPSSSDPLDEQAWLVNTINKLMSLPTWSSTAIIIDWDDSDGWYDSVMPPIVSPSADPNNDLLNGAGVCGQGPSPLGVSDRCGYGPRIPLLVISPYAKSNYVDSTLASQTAIVSFIEYNWKLGNLGPESYDHLSGSIMNAFDFSHPQANNGVLYLNPATGEVISTSGSDSTSLAQLDSGTPGVPNLNTLRTCTDVDTNPDVCSTGNTITSSQIHNDVWFSALANITRRESSVPSTVYFTGQLVNLMLKGGNSIPLSISAPNSEIVFSPTAKSVTTSFTSTGWVITAPVGFTGTVFIGGVAYKPNGANLADARVDWTGEFSGTNVSFTLNWKWAGAVYSRLGTSAFGSTAYYNSLGVKPTGITAGTPQNFVSDYVSSATSGSAVKYVGAYSAAASAYYQAYLLNE